MDQSYKFPGSPGTPLFQSSPDRVNQQRPPSVYDDSPINSIHGRHSRESSVHEKVAAFNNLAFQGKQLERKANDAALKRAMLGREEAESEMRRFREDVRILKRKVEEGQDRERKVGERLESVMENYGRAKETHAHTQTLWEKEIRRARKENFKSQSVVVKLQEELKASRQASKIMQTDLEQEKQRSVLREQEAFAARYQLVGVQEELANLQDHVKLIEQERDALRMIAQNEEIARIAAEGQIPLPRSEEEDEFSSPKKGRKSLELATITSSATSEAELEELRILLEWEQYRANRALDRVEYLEAECGIKCYQSKSSQSAVHKHEHEHAIEEKPKAIFIPSEGIFRTISPVPQESPWISPAKKNQTPIFPEEDYHETPSQARRQPAFPPHDLPMHTRTPSIEPPAPAILQDDRTSLLSLLDAPLSPIHSHEAHENSPPTPARTSDGNSTINIDDSEQPTPTQERVQMNEDACRQIPTFHTISTTTRVPLKIETPKFHEVSTTTRIPLADIPDLQPNHAIPHPPLSPTMSREKALAQIRERRGRARSLAQGTLTPRKQMVVGKERRDISAPAIRSGAIRGRLASRS